MEGQQQAAQCPSRPSPIVNLVARPFQANSSEGWSAFYDRGHIFLDQRTQPSAHISWRRLQSPAIPRHLETPWILLHQGILEGLPGSRLHLLIESSHFQDQRKVPHELAQLQVSGPSQVFPSPRGTWSRSLVPQAGERSTRRSPYRKTRRVPRPASIIR